MKLVRFEQDTVAFYGVLEGDTIRRIEGDFFGQLSFDGQTVRRDRVRLLAPCEPSKAVCVGLNYHDHAREMNLKLPEQPLLFLKPPSSINHPGGDIEYPRISHNLHFEAELAVVMKKTARHVSAAHANEYILGYTCANDVTARDIQTADGQWTRGKSFDTFLPLGPWIETDIDPAAIPIRLLLNGEAKQTSNTNNLIFKVPDLIAYITAVMTLNPGDVILTGTPSGVGPMQAGDVVSVELAGIGVLTNTVIQG